jgi:type IV secretion system protein VirD4
MLSIKDSDPSLKRIRFDQPYETAGGIVVANYVEDGHRTMLVAPPSHTLLVGSTGSGKTQSFYMPQLEFLAHSTDKPSMLIMDAKHEIYREKADMLRKQGYKVIALDGSRPYLSAKYNPLSLIWRAYHRAEDAKALLAAPLEPPYSFNGKDYGDDERAFRTAVNAFINCEIDFYNSLLSVVVETMIPIPPTVREPSWDYGSREITSLTLLSMLEDSLVPSRGMTPEKFSLYNMVNVINSRQDDCDTLVSYVQLHNRNSHVRRLESYICSKARVTRDSFLMNTINHLNRVVNHSCNSLTCGDDIDIEEVVHDLDKPTAIFLIVDSTNEATHLVCNLFLRQLMAELQHRGVDNPDYDFHVLWDEFATSGMVVPNIGNWITTMRSHRVWFHLGVQSYQQLDALYTKEARVNISGNAKLIFCGSNDTPTIKEVSESFGMTIGAVTSYAVSNTGDIQMSVVSNNVPVVRVSDLTQLNLGEAYVRIFSESGNKQLRTVLDPNFRCADFAHDNAAPAISTAYLDFDIKSTFYDIEEVISKEEDEDTDIKPSWDSF